MSKVHSAAASIWIKSKVVKHSKTYSLLKACHICFASIDDTCCLADHMMVKSPLHEHMLSNKLSAKA